MGAIHTNIIKQDPSKIVIVGAMCVGRLTCVTGPLESDRYAMLTGGC